MKTLATALATLTLLTSLTLSTQARTPRVNTRQQAQRARIQEGVASGELTRREAQRLRTGQQVVRQQERLAKADGEVTHQERRGLERQQDRQSRAIHRQKNDAQSR